MTLRRIRSLSDVTPADRGTSAAIGNFDGVHLGHQRVLDLARAAGQPLSVLTFEPHPRQVFRPEDPPFRLMSPEARASRLAKLGVDVVFEVPFEPALYTLDHAAFAQEVLVDGLGLAHATVGADFRYGTGRTGDGASLQAAGAALGFGVTLADLVANADQEVSSTAIRAALSEGRCPDATAMLGHHHRIEGPVIHGEKRGRTLGFPTANMDLSGLHLPRFGVYAVRVDVQDGPHTGRYLGAASLGVRPMFGENMPNLETYVLDFTGDLYGATLSVGLVEFLRPELAYEGVDKLVAQMTQDCVDARAVLAKLDHSVA